MELLSEIGSYENQSDRVQQKMFDMASKTQKI